MPHHQEFLTVSVIAHVDHTVIRPAGELDASTTTQLRTALNDVADTSDGRAVVVDLGDITFIDSSGISALVSARHEFDGRGVDLTISHVSAQVERVLDICGVTDWLTRSAPVQ